MDFSSLSSTLLKEERKRLRLNQAEIAGKCGVSREIWGRYERGSAVPGGEVLKALADLGADVQYILTGVNRAAPHDLTADELELLELFRTASLARKMEAVRVLSGGPSSPSPDSSSPPKKAPPASRAKAASASADKQSGKGAKQVFHGPVGQAVEGGITNHQGVIFNVGNGKSKE